MDEIPPVWPDAPRYAPKVPLPPYRFLPELHPHPRRDPEGSFYGRPAPQPGLAADQWQRDDTYLHAIDLYHQGFLWEAHEHWESCFFAARVRDGRQADFIQSLIQLAAAAFQVHRGKADGARFLATRASQRLVKVSVGMSNECLIAGLSPREILDDIQRYFAPELIGAPESDRGRSPRLRLRQQSV